MRLKAKLTIALLVLSAGIGGALLFRKPRQHDALITHGPEVQFQAVAEAPAWQPTTPAPPVESHLLGRIDTSHSATDESAAPPATSPISPSDLHHSQAPASEMPENSPWSAANPHDGGDLLHQVEDLYPPSSNRLAASRRTKAARVHKVKDGDNLTKLAKTYLGSADRYQEIYQANATILRNPDVLPIGATLTIPDARASATAEVPQQTSMVDIPMEKLRSARTNGTVATPAATAKTYRVQAHDTLVAIARHFYGDASRSSDLLNANRNLLSRPEDLREGMTLVIP